MILNNINNGRKERGFTIVELLIVIVVIGILAAITIVAYSGVTSRANAAKAQTNAANVQRVVEAYNADSVNTGYPADAATLNTYSGTATSIVKIPTAITVVASVALALTDANGKTTVSYLAKSTTGGCIGYWNYAAAIPAATFIYAGNAIAATTTTCT